MNFTALVFKNHYKSILLFFIMINIVIGITALVVYDKQLQYMENNIVYNIDEYGEIDREHLCKLIECSTVIDMDNNKRFIFNRYLKKTKWQEFSTIDLWRNIKLIDYSIAIYNKTADSYFILKQGKLFNSLHTIFFILVPIAMIVFLYPLFISIRNEKENAIRYHSGNEALLANKSMIMITENIHHELNTPLEIIDNKIEKIHRVIDDYLLDEYHAFQEYEAGKADDKTSARMSRYEWEENEKRSINQRLIKLTPDFEFIKTSSEQIYNILEKMKGFKHMRYSNGNKTITDIVESAFKIISISNTNYEYEIDDRLKAYSISSKEFKNADLLGIIINNIKNSLEASASKIFIIFNGFNKDKLKLRIVDNGQGIPKKILKKIFEPNFSTKSNDESVRGNGMYLNKQILKQVGGDTYIVESSKYGTTLEIIIPAKLRDSEQEDKNV